jgi:HSP20 family protein
MTPQSELTRWNPLNELEELQSRAKSFFMRPNGGPSLLGTAGVDADWTPAVDVSEDDHEFLITADLPDVTKENVKVSIEDNMLVIQGERQQEKVEKDRKYHRTERSYGRYLRSFQLPKDIDAQKIEARFSSGVLKVHLPKIPVASHAAHQIKVD